MSQLRLKISLNRGRKGIPLRKLANITDETQKFLGLFSNDINLGDGEWIAENFRNGSVIFDMVFVGDVPEPSILQGQRALDHITDLATTADSLGFGLTKGTFHQFAKIALPLEEDDVVSLGIYNGRSHPKIRKLSKERALEIEKQIVQTKVQYSGFQGKISALIKGSNTIWVTDLLNGHRVICRFQPNMYDQIIHLLKKREAIVNIEGWRKIKNDEERLEIQSIQEAAEYQEGDIEKFFGCDPNFTNDLDTEEFLAQLRTDAVN